MRASAKLLGVGLLLSGIGCATSYEGDEGLNPAVGEIVPGPDVREGGLSDTLPWNGEATRLPIVVAARREHPRNLQVTNRTILWTEYPSDGRSPAVVVLDKASGDMKYLSSEGSLPWSVAFDGREVFWADPIDETVWSVSPEGSVPVKVGAPAGAALVTADRVGPVWANYDGTIWSRDPATAFISRIAFGPGVPQAILVDDTRVYWISGAAGAILSAARDGGPAKQIAEVGGDVTKMGFVGDWLVWLDPEKGEVRAVPRAGGESVMVASGLHGAEAATFDAEAAWVLAGVQGNQLFKIPFDGAPATVHVRGVGSVTELASDGAFVYAIDGSTGNVNAYRRR